MRWLLWIAGLVWSRYYEYGQRLYVLQRIRHTVAGVGLCLLSYFLGFCTIVLMLASAFFLFSEQMHWAKAALWTTGICAAMTLIAAFFTQRFFRRV